MYNRRAMNFEHLYGSHRNYVIRSLQQLFNQKPIDLETESIYLSTLDFSETTCQSLSSMANAIYSNRRLIAPNTYAVKLSKYSFCVYDGTLRILLADDFLTILESLLENAFNQNDKNTLDNVISFIHDELDYFQIGSPMLIKLYRLEEERAYLKMLEGIYTGDDEEAKLYRSYMEEVETEFNKTLRTLDKNTSYTVKVWLLRELYYFHSSLEGCDSSTSFVDAYRSLRTGDESKFREIMDMNNIDHFGYTNPDIYLNAVRTYNSAIKLPPLARFNILLNLSHCNGTMATKYIKCRSKDMKRNMNGVIDFLDGLSNGQYTKDIPYKIYKTLGVLPKWFVAN
jgi:hypothetical protein